MGLYQHLLKRVGSTVLSRAVGHIRNAQNELLPAGSSGLLTIRAMNPPTNKGPLGIQGLKPNPGGGFENRFRSFSCDGSNWNFSSSLNNNGF
jgi:hypothetical protein